MKEMSATLAPIDLLEAPDKLAKFTRNLPDSDGEPMENEREWLEISLILDSLYEHWQGRTDFFAGGNMFLYYHLAQAKQIVAEMKGKAQRHAFRGPDVFVVLNVDGSYRRQKWVVWEEGGRFPDLIFEFFSPSTQRADRTTKKELYEQTFQTPEYYWYDPFNPALFQGWQLDEEGHYQEMAQDERGWIWSPALQLWIGRWEGVYRRDRAIWLRLYDREGQLVLTSAEAAQKKLKETQEKVKAAEAEAAHLRAELARLKGENG